MALSFGRSPDVGETGKHQSERLRPWGRAVGSPAGFSMIELLTVVIIIGVMMGTVAIVYQAAARQTDLKAAAEMLKQEIRKVYAFADAGKAVEYNGQKYRDRYRIEFNRESGDPGPPNTYHVIKRSFDAAKGDWKDWEPVAPEHGAAYEVDNADGQQWIKISSSPNTVVLPLNNASKGPTGLWGITFISRGSIVVTDCNGDTTITLRATDQKQNSQVTVSMFGSVSQ